MVADVLPGRLKFMSDEGDRDALEDRDPVRKLLIERAEQRRYTLADLSRAANKNAAYIHQYVHRGSPKVLPEEVRIRIATLLDLRPEDLVPEDLRNELAASQTRGHITAGGGVPAPAGFTVRCYADTGSVTGPGQALQAGYPADFALSLSAQRVGGRLMPGDVVGFQSFPPPRVGDLVAIIRRGSGEIAGLGWLRAASPEKLTVATDAKEEEFQAKDHVAYRHAWTKST